MYENTILNCNNSTLKVFKLNYKEPLTLTFVVETINGEPIVKITKNNNILGLYKTNDVRKLIKMFFIKLVKFNKKKIVDIENNDLLKNNLTFTMHDIINYIIENKNGSKIHKIKNLLGLSFKELSCLLGIKATTLRTQASNNKISSYIEKIIDLTLENIELKNKLKDKEA